ncbi:MULTISPECIES: hypothetical protein [Streptomyces]|uniref:hypothetical protein n=1 Tax=Streptomyces TaxID=1883 RepID=UPI00163BD605|nr:MULTISPECIES: hypothetical protein [Streptomyces]MBC2876436.1 hypothetical protein [Streptomyces sp. TYQ1024]UBI40895.1 hypothetical protein K7I03_33465 [Streptomyces mobaraensis]
MAGVTPGSVDGTDDLDVCRQVAFRVARKGHSATVEVLSVVEDLLGEEAEYEFVVTFLEDLQNLVSHGLDVLRSADEIRLLLGPRNTICWDTLNAFWAAVADWRVRTGQPLQPAAPLLGVQDDHLRMLLWTTNRALPSGEKLGIADAVRYEKAGEPTIPGYSHIAVALRIAGQDGS